MSVRRRNTALSARVMQRPFVLSHTARVAQGIDHFSISTTARSRQRGAKPSQKLYGCIVACIVQRRLHLLSSAERLASSSRPEPTHNRKRIISPRSPCCGCCDVHTQRLLELLGVDDGGAGLATSEDALLEARVERRVVVGVVGCATKVESTSVDLLDTTTRAHGEDLLVAGWGLQTRAHTIANKVISMRPKRDNAAEGDCCSLDGERLLLALVLLVVGHVLSRGDKLWMQKTKGKGDDGLGQRLSSPRGQRDSRRSSSTAG